PLSWLSPLGSLRRRFCRAPKKGGEIQASMYVPSRRFRLLCACRRVERTRATQHEKNAWRSDACRISRSRRNRRFRHRGRGFPPPRLCPIYENSLNVGCVLALVAPLASTSSFVL